MRGDPSPPPYQGRRQEPVSLINTFERLAVAIGMAAKKGELTETEHLIAVSLGAHFGAENDQLARQVSEMREQVLALQELLLQIYRESA